MSIFKLSFLKFTKLFACEHWSFHETFFYAGQLSEYWLGRSPYTILHVLYTCSFSIWGNFIHMFYACSITIYLGEKTWQVVQSQNLSVPCEVLFSRSLNAEAQILGWYRQHRETLRWVPEQLSLLYGNVFPCYQLVWVVQGAGEGARVS